MVAGEKGLIRFEDVYKYAFTGAHCGSLEDEEFNAIVNAIESVPKVDAVEVVRCKDCYHNEQCICVCCEDGEMIKCGLHHKHMDANGYCHEGRRC